MTHTKFQGHQPFGSREAFLRFLPYMGMAAILVSDQDHLSKLSFPHPIEAPYEIWLWLAQWFLRRRCLKECGRRRRTMEAYYPISSPKEPSAQVSKKIHCFTMFSYKSIRDQIWPCRKIGQGQPSGPVNAHLTPGPGIYFNAFIHVYSPRAGADNPIGTNVDVNRKPLSFCPFVATFKTISLKSDFIHVFPHVYSPGQG